MSYSINDQGEILRPEIDSNGSSPNKKYNYLIVVALILIVGIGSMIYQNRQGEVDRINTEVISGAKSKENAAAEAQKIENDKIAKAAKLVKEARALYDDDKFQNAIYKLQQAINLNPKYLKDSDFKRLRGASYFKLKNFVLANKDFTGSINISPNNANVYYFRALSYSSLDNYYEASKDYAKAIELSEGTKKALFYFRRGEYHAGLNNNNLADQDYAMAFRLDPTNRIYINKIDEIKAKKANISSSLPVFLYMTKTISFGEIPSLKRFPSADSENIRSNFNNENVYVIQETTQFFYKVKIDGKIGYISSSYLVPHEKSSFNNNSNKKNISSKGKEKLFSIKVKSKKAYIYSSPIKKRKYRTKIKYYRSTIFETKTKNIENQFFLIKYYDNKVGYYRDGYLHASDVSINNN